LFPNQFVNVRMLVQTMADATLVPSAAIQRGAPGTFVYVVKDDKSVTVTAGDARAGPRRGHGHRERDHAWQSGRRRRTDKLAKAPRSN